MISSKITARIKRKALDLGFSGVTIAKARRLDDEALQLEKWLNQNHHGNMSYMENYFEERVDPTKLVPGTKSVISFLYNYYSEEIQEDSSAPKISKYAYGRDYHKVIKGKLKNLFNWVKDQFGDVNGRYFVDSAPILERDWAKISGLGWTGKNTLLITPQKGSYFFLAELLIDIELDYDHPIKDYCGTCKRCIDACPTDAIAPEGYLLDSNKCISYLTIELKDEIPLEFNGKLDNWMYGCDICQQVCPWNRFSSAHNEPDFLPRKDLLKIKKEDWLSLSEDEFDYLFNGSAVRRTKFSGLKRNIEFLQKSHWYSENNKRNNSPNQS